MNTKIKRIVLFLFTLAFSLQFYGQNLIADPSFEDANLSNTSTLDFLSQLNQWWTVSPTPDYHHEQNNGSNLTQLNDCPLGNGDLDCGVAYDGEAVLGLAKGSGSDAWKEWAATQLVEPMVAGECYVVSFWAQNKKDNPSYIMETSNWGVFFGTTGLLTFDPETIDFDLVTNQYVATTEILDSNDWRNFQFIYTADYAYTFAYVGFMGNLDDASTNAYINDQTIGYYIWMDMVNIIPVDSVEIDAMPDFELCQDSSAELSASCNVFYEWAWDDGSGNMQFSDDSILVVSPDLTTTYYAFAGEYEDCVKMDSVTVNVIDCSCLIPIETTFTVSNNTNCPISQPGNGWIAVEPSNGIEPYFYEWNDPYAQTTDTAFGLAGGNYICIITDTDDCQDTIYASITEASVPTFVFDVTPESCFNSIDGAIDLTVLNGYAPYTYVWSNDSTTEDISGLGSDTYTVSIIDNNNCPYTDSAFVDFAPLAEYSFPIICEASGVTDLNTLGVSNGTWSGPGIVDPALGLFDPDVSGNGTFDIYFVSNVDCTDDFMMEVIVDAQPNVNFTANLQQGCQPLNVFFSAPDDGPGSTYIWDFGDGNVSSNPVNTQFTYVNHGIFDVTLTVTDTNGCANSLTYPEYINVYERPVADFNFTPKEIDDVQSQVQFTSTSSDATSNWYWTFGDGGVSYTENPIHEYSQPGYFEVSLTASSDIGCTDIVTDFIKYKEVIYMYVPNAFTPNNDGRNDVFLVEARGEINLFSLKIYDRWGTLVFETTNINEPWVGNKMGGDYYLNTEVFNYILEYEAWGPQLEEPIGETIHGTIMLMK